MRLHEIIQTGLTKSLSYDPKQHRLKVTDPDPQFTLRHLNRIKKLRCRYLEQERRVKVLRRRMYGGDAAAKRTEIETAEAELMKLQAEIAAEIEASGLDRRRKDHLKGFALNHIARGK